jgi:hypothetical protein
MKNPFLQEPERAREGDSLVALQRQALDLLGVSHRLGSRSQQAAPHITKAQVNIRRADHFGGTWD